MPAHRPEMLSVPLLITEDLADFNWIHRGFVEDFKPEGRIEKGLVFDLAYSQFEKKRYRRELIAATNRRFRQALQNVLIEPLREPDQWGIEVEEDAATLAAQWFTDEGRVKIQKLLKALKLDEAVIETEVTRLARDEIECLEKLLCVAEARFHQTLRTLQYILSVPIRRWRNGEAPMIEGNRRPCLVGGR